MNGGSFVGSSSGDSMDTYGSAIPLCTNANAATVRCVDKTGTNAGFLAGPTCGVGFHVATNTPSTSDFVAGIYRKASDISTNGDARQYVQVIGPQVSLKGSSQLRLLRLRDDIGCGNNAYHVAIGGLDSKDASGNTYSLYASSSCVTPDADACALLPTLDWTYEHVDGPSAATPRGPTISPLVDIDLRHTCPAAERPDHIRWVHIPKTGTTFGNTVLHTMCQPMPDEAGFGEEATTDPFEVPFQQMIRKYGYGILKQCDENGLLDTNSIRGHMPASYSRDEGYLVSMFREPYSRLYSEFKFVNVTCSAIVRGEIEPEAAGIVQAIGLDPYAVLSMCGYDARTGSQLGWVGMDFNKFLTELQGLGGCQTKMILGRVCHDTAPVTDADLNLAISTMRTNFKYVGVMERWEESVKVFHQLYGGQTLPIELMAQRQTKKTGVVDFGGFRDNVDEAFYAAVLTMFEDQAKRGAACNNK
jgi:hypothetical protein